MTVLVQALVSFHQTCARTIYPGFAYKFAPGTIRSSWHGVAIATIDVRKQKVLTIASMVSSGNSRLSMFNE